MRYSSIDQDEQNRGYGTMNFAVENFHDLQMMYLCNALTITDFSTLSLQLSSRSPEETKDSRPISEYGS